MATLDSIVREGAERAPEPTILAAAREQLLPSPGGVAAPLPPAAAPVRWAA